MFKCSVGKVQITIDLEPGIYLFNNKSSTGKSYLCDLLKLARSKGIRADGYTFTDYKSGRLLIEYLDTQKLKHDSLEVILIDRYDLYNGVFDSEIEILSKNSIIIIDSKEGIDLDYEMCFIEFKRGELNISLT